MKVFLHSLILFCFFTACGEVVFQPDFLILGVTKCGTTSLYSYLTKHPKIRSAYKKEIHFFDDTYKAKKGMRLYKNYFPDKNQTDELIGEATPCYFWLENCLTEIFKNCFKTKMIVIFRNPVKGAISEYFRLKRRGKEEKSFAEALEVSVGSEKWVRYFSAGCYSYHLKRWLEYFPQEQIHIVILDDLVTHPADEVNKVFKFLGLQEYTLDSYEPENKASYDLNEISESTIQLLREFYKPYNQELEKMLGRKLRWD